MTWMVVPLGRRSGFDAVFFGGSTGTQGFFSRFFFAGVPEEEDRLDTLDSAWAWGTATADSARALATPALMRIFGVVWVRMRLAFSTGVVETFQNQRAL